MAEAAIEPTANPVAAAVQGELPLLPAPTNGNTERVAAALGTLPEVPAVFAPTARVPLAGMFLALPALEATSLLECAGKTFTELFHQVYGLNTMLLEGVLRTLIGEPRAQGATRLDPIAFARILGIDRAPEVKTIRRQHQGLVATGKVPELKKRAPELRSVIGDDRRMLVGFDRGGWSPTLFSHLHHVGFDVLIWHKGATDDIDEDSEKGLFAAVSHVDEHGITSTWAKVADTKVEALLNAKTGETFRMRQVSQMVPVTKGEGTRQIHLLTTWTPTRPWTPPRSSTKCLHAGARKTTSGSGASDLP